MVLATETVAPITAPSRRLNPAIFDTAAARPRINKIPRGAPARATHLTRFKSGIENSTPAENINNTTPTSANNSKKWESDKCGPGVNGLIAIPPNTKPRIRGRRTRHARSPPTTAATNMYVRSRNRIGFVSIWIILKLQEINTYAPMDVLETLAD